MLASKVVVVESEAQVRAIPESETAVAGFVGLTERGPIGVATLVSSWDEYLKTFGGYVADSDLPQAVQGFFENGGRYARIVRTCHYTDVDTPGSYTATKGTVTLETEGGQETTGSVVSDESAPFAIEDGDTLIASIDGGENATATFVAKPAAVENDAGATYDFSGDAELDVEINGAEQTVTMTSGYFVDQSAATAAEAAAAINAQLRGGRAYLSSGGTRITIESDKRGTDASVQVTGGDANTELEFPTAAVAGTGNVDDADSVTGAEIKTIVEAAIDGSVVSGSTYVTFATETPGADGSIQFAETSTALAKIGLDTVKHSGADSDPGETVRIDARDPGAYAARVTVRIADATSGEAEEFNLQVLVDDAVAESFPNLTMVPDGDRYIETMLNHADYGSRYVAAVDLDLDGTDEERRPANGTSAALSGGGDGLTSLADTDFIGSPAGKTGLYAFDVVEDLSLLAVPGRATSAVHNAMITYCETYRGGLVFAVLDVPEDSTAEEAVTYVSSTAALYDLSEHGAIYWPWAQVINPSQRVFGTADRITVPPSGHICGLFARTDASQPGGVYLPPAGVERGILRGVVGFETTEAQDERKRDLVYPKRINPLTTARGLPRYIDGNRTLKGNGNFPGIAERRGVSYIERSIRSGLEFARHSNNDGELRARVERTVIGFLLRQMRVGAFRSTNPATAFFVDVSDRLNPPSEQFAGRLHVRVGLATQKAIDWVILDISQDTRALDEELAAAQQ